MDDEIVENQPSPKPTQAQTALDAVLPDLYDQLKALALAQLQNERPDHTLQATALAHEAYLRLAKQHKLNVDCRAQFYFAASKVIRRVLIDHARSRRAQKRGNDAERIPFSGIDLVDTKTQRGIDLLEMDETLNRLGRLHDRAAQVVELRFFGGLTLDEAAAALGISRRTVAGDWEMARLWLRSELS